MSAETFSPEQIREALTHRPVCIVGMQAAETGTPFAFTIGRTDRGLPEMIIIAPSDDSLPACGTLLVHADKYGLMAGQTLEFPGLVTMLAVEPPSEVVPDLHEHCVYHADRYYGRPVDLLCLIRVDGETPQSIHLH